MKSVGFPMKLRKPLKNLKDRFDSRHKVYIVNRHHTVICCTMRNDDLLRMETYFRRNKSIIINKPELADTIVLNTCAFDKEREKVSLELIREFSKYRGKLIVTGCIGKINQEAMHDVLSGDYIAAPELNEKLDASFAAAKVPFNKILVHGKESSLYDGGIGWRKMTKPNQVPRVGTVKVINGCPHKCSYCTHRLAIGIKPDNVPLEKIFGIVHSQINQGANVIQLLGDNLGPYGVGINSNVPQLVRALSDKFNPTRFALDQYHAAYFVRDYHRGLRELIAENRIYEIKMPIQSGCVRILKIMQRATPLKKLAEFVAEAIRLDPKILWVTHIITGFPSETESEFQETVDYIKNVFNHNALVYIFPCSVHPDTPAAHIRPRVTPQVAIDRALIAEKEFRSIGIDVCLDQLDILNSRKAKLLAVN